MRHPPNRARRIRGPIAARFTPLAAALATLWSGCAAGPDFVAPSATSPSVYTAQPLGSVTASADTAHGAAQQFVAERELPARWWELFGCEPLNALVRASLVHNPDVEAAQAALRGAWENVYAQQGFFYPSVDAGFAPTRQRISGSLATPASSGASYYNLYTAQVSVSYTADVFGANRRQVESLTAQAESQRFQLQATYLTLTANVVNAAIQEAALRGQIQATRDIIAIQEQLMASFVRQRELGQVATADVAAQEAALAAAQATLPPLEKQLAVQRDLLTALAGRYPSDAVGARFVLDDLTLPVELPVSLPSTLVDHRPDVRAALEQLHAASAAIGVAVANRLPTITLGLTGLGSAATTLPDLLKSRNLFWELAGGITQPVFDGGTLRHREYAARAAYDQAAAQYRATVLNAFQNVADSLQALASDALALQAADKAQRAADLSLAIARRQRVLGDLSTLQVLAGEQTDLQARLNLVQAQANRLADTVALFQSLGGGGWPATSSAAAAAGPGADPGPRDALRMPGK